MIDRIRSSPEWRFLAVFPQAARGLSRGWWSFIAVRGLLPPAFAIATGVLIGAVQRHAGLAVPLAVVGGVFVAMNALGPVHGTVGSLLGARSGAWLHDRLMAATIEPPGLAHLERADLGDELARAREFDQGIVAPPLEAALPYIANGFSEIWAGLASAVLLATYRWWAALALAAAWTATHRLLKDSAMWRIFDAEGVVGQRRHVDYAYRLAVESPGAKEVRLFGLSDWMVERFTRLRRTLADLLYHERRLRSRGLSWSLLVIGAGNVLVFGSLARGAMNGTLPLVRLVVYAQAAIGVASLGFGEFEAWPERVSQISGARL